MPKFSRVSKERLKTCDPRLQQLFKEVIKHFDCIILEGYRDKTKQDDYFHKGLSKLKWPESCHNSKPSLAIDVAPYPIDWDDTAGFYFLGGFVKGIASQMGLKVTWGGDWDSDYDFSDQTFNDFVHFELKPDGEYEYKKEETDEDVEIEYNFRNI